MFKRNQSRLLEIVSGRACGVWGCGGKSAVVGAATPASVMGMKKKYMISTGISGRDFAPKEGGTHAKIDSPDRTVHYSSSNLSLLVPACNVDAAKRWGMSALAKRWKSRLHGAQHSEG